jgi:type I restriction enzyme M protein
VHSSLKQLIFESKTLFPFDEPERVELVSTCFVYAVMAINNDLPDGVEHKQPVTFQTLNVMLNKTFKLSSLRVSHQNIPEYEGSLTQFINQLLQLLKQNIISAHTLIETVYYMHNTSKFSYAIPSEVCELGIALLGEQCSVYCPFGKGYNFALRLPIHTKAVCETGSREDSHYAKLLNYLHNRSITIKDSDPILNPRLVDDDKLKQFEASIAMPPFGQKLKGKIAIDIWERFPEESLMGEVYYLRHMLAHSTKKVVCFVSDAFLFRTAAGEKLFKEDVLEKNWLEGVIALPAGLLSHTSAPINAIILNKEKNCTYVRFINARTGEFVEPLSKTKNRLQNIQTIVSEFESFSIGDHTADTGTYEIEDNEYNLSPTRYVLSEGDKKFHDFLTHFRKAPLKELVEFIRPQSLSHDDRSDVTFSEYGLNNLNDINHLEGKARIVKVNKRLKKRAEKQHIQANDVLVVCRGAVGKVAFVPEGIEDNAVANQAFTILRIKQGCRRMTPKALFQYLSSEFGKYQLTSLATGTTSLMLSSKDIQSMVVPGFEKPQLEVLGIAHDQTKEKYEQIEALRTEIKNVHKTTIKAIAS